MAQFLLYNFFILYGTEVINTHKTVEYLKNDQVLTMVPKFCGNLESGEITMENLERGKLLEESSVDTLDHEKDKQVGPRAT